MISGRTIRARRKTAAICCALCCLAMSVYGFSQVSGYGDKQAGENTGNELPRVLKAVAVTQHLNQQLPLNAAFVDETGKPVVLGDYFGKRPAVLSLVYYNCPMLCSEEMDGLTSSLEMVKLTPGKDFDVVIISIDPSETPEMAAKKKAFYLKRYGRPETAAGWHYLTGQEAGDRCGDGCGWFRVCAGAGTGWETFAVCSCEFDRVGDDGWQTGAILSRCRVLAEGHDVGADRGLGQ